MKISTALNLPLLALFLAGVTIKMTEDFNRMSETLANYSGNLGKRMMENSWNLQVAKDAAEKANRAKAGFLTHLSHEIRSPLNSALGMTDLLLETSLNEEQRKYAGAIRTSAQNLLTILNEISDIRIDTGGIRLSSEPVNLKILCRGIISLMKPLADRQGLSLLLDLSPEIPELVVIDEMRLRRVLTNLVSNAVKATPSGSVILAADTDGLRSKLLFSVKETGVGIESYRQLDSPLDQTDGGSEQGLTTTRKLIRVMGGNLSVDSEPRQGTVVQFWLPLVPASIEAETKGRRWEMEYFVGDEIT